MAPTATMSAAHIAAGIPRLWRLRTLRRSACLVGVITGQPTAATRAPRSATSPLPQDTETRTAPVRLSPVHLPSAPATTEQLLDLCARLYLVVKFSDLGTVAARYTRQGAFLPHAVIILDNRLHGPALRCTLAEEIGHHLTLVGCLPGWDGHPCPWTERNEAQALRIAVELLIPCNGIGVSDTADDVAEWWGVTAAFAEKAMRLRAESALACSAVRGLHPNVP